MTENHLQRRSFTPVGENSLVHKFTTDRVNNIQGKILTPEGKTNFNLTDKFLTKMLADIKGFYNDYELFYLNSSHVGGHDFLKKELCDNMKIYYEELGIDENTGNVLTKNYLYIIFCNLYKDLDPEKFTPENFIKTHIEVSKQYEFRNIIIEDVK